ncbi:MAG TPA: CBS domain-containing protein [Anaerolineales bacterium]|nr:CBS domain-containing protein [Anaerolineales bacterium]
MHLVCTHEQADFDAVASLLGVRLLDPEAMPVLPRRVNRNVRAFVTLYGDHLPFVEFGELPRSRVEQITIVDTQSSPSFKGVHAGTKVHLIDHHPRGEDLDSSWSTHIEEVGATATLLVEEVQEVGRNLSPVQATLLLLGIYEDTGSLSYASTTPRDMRASAWLLERGANLNLVGEFLNHPLSNGQRDLYDRLLESIETHVYHGFSILVACGEERGLVEEISTLAHKLRDVFDPDGLFVLVGLDGSVQLVARSTIDELDVGAVAEHFGGGGHARAAAALIRKRNSAQVRDELLEFLGSLIEPAPTVGEIMSRDPQLLRPNAKISDVGERMQRFGHEGYPIVESGRVCGLLTRRAVDRALSHGMGSQAVSRIMEAGDLVVRMDDSVNHLQKVMIEHGWGQVPVVDPESGEIVGIVTRTDLLNSLGTGLEREYKPSLVGELEEVLPGPRLALLRLVAGEAEQRGDALYIVGGFVRDLILSAPSVDYDFVVEGDAIGLARSLASAYGGRESSHQRFGTAKWQLDLGNKQLCAALESESLEIDTLPKYLDFVSARTEFYTHPTALPSIQRGSIKLDLHRRDFTINTLALRLDGRYYGQLLDHWGGGRDLRNRKIRVLHSLSFMDDPTRILRAIRLEQRFEFHIEDRTLELLDEAIPLLDRVSGERIRSEFDTIFNEPKFAGIMARLQSLGLLEAIHPAMVWDSWLAARFEAIRCFEPLDSWRLEEPPEREFLYYAVWLFRLTPQEADGVGRRLRFPSAVLRDILQTVELNRFLQSLAETPAPSTVVARLDDVQKRAIIASCLALQDLPMVCQILEKYFMEWRFIQPKADGEALRAMELPQGPIYGEILWKLRAAWLDGEIRDEEQENALLEAIVKEALASG